MIRIRHLYPNGRFRTSKGDTRPDQANYVFTTVGKTRQAFLLLQNPVIRESRNPRRFNTWDDFMQSEPIPPDLDSGKGTMLAFGHNIYPVSAEDRLDQEEREAVGARVFEEINQAGQAKASKDEFGSNMQKGMLLVFTLSFAFITVLLGILGFNTFFGGDSSAATTSLQTLPLLGFSLLKRKREKSEPRIIWEKVYVYSEVSSEVVLLPREVIQAHLDYRSRWEIEKIDVMGYQFTLIEGWGMLLGPVLGLLVAYMPVLIIGILALGLSLLEVLGATIVIGLPLGVYAGKKIALFFVVPPLSVMRKNYLQDEEGAQYIEAESIIHTQFTDEGRAYRIEEYEVDGKKHKRILPEVYTTTSLYSDLQAMDETSFYKGRSKSTWEKVELGLIATIALSSLGLFFLFVAAYGNS